MKHFFELFIKLIKHFCFSVKFVLLGFHVHVSNNNCNDTESSLDDSKKDNTSSNLQEEDKE